MLARTNLYIKRHTSHIPNFLDIHQNANTCDTHPQMRNSTTSKPNLPPPKPTNNTPQGTRGGKETGIGILPKG